MVLIPFWCVTKNIQSNNRRKSRTLPENCTSQTETRHFEQIERNQRKTLAVVILTAVMMVVELLFGYLTSSMSLLADGWHMASHTGALLITYLAYMLAKSPTLGRRFSFGTGKFIPLGGYTSAVSLAIVAVLMAVESFARFLSPQAVQFDEAILVSAIGLVVNIASAFILGIGSDFHSHSHAHGAEGHSHSPDATTHHGHDHNRENEPEHQHGHKHSHDRKHDVTEKRIDPPSPAAPDHNIRSAYYHVLADALTSILALVALFIGKYYDAPRVDALMGAVGAVIILRWAYFLCKDTAWELLDGHAKHIPQEEMIHWIQREGVSVDGLHLWQVGPHLTACEIIVSSPELRGPEFYKSRIRERYELQHIIVEERLITPT